LFFCSFDKNHAKIRNIGEKKEIIRGKFAFGEKNYYLCAAILIII